MTNAERTLAALWLARYATNGWACYAKTKRELDEIGRLHREIDALKAVLDEPVVRLEALGRAGFIVSVCCGPCGADPFRWTVQAMNALGQEFDQSFAASSFEHAIEIAELEITKRGWR